MLRFDPFREIEELQQHFDRALGGGTRGSDQNFFSPVVDIHEDERGLEIDLDLPGISPENIRVEAENNTITIQGERRYEGTQGRTAHRTERIHGTFVRTFNIPPRYDLSRIEANYENGALALRVPRREQAMRRAIPIRTSGSTQPQTLEAGGTAADAGQGQETQTGQNTDTTQTGNQQS